MNFYALWCPQTILVFCHRTYSNTDLTFRLMHSNLIAAGTYSKTTYFGLLSQVMVRPPFRCQLQFTSDMSGMRHCHFRTPVNPPTFHLFYLSGPRQKQKALKVDCPDTVNVQRTSISNIYILFIACYPYFINDVKCDGSLQFCLWAIPKDDSSCAVFVP